MATGDGSSRSDVAAQLFNPKSVLNVDSLLVRFTVKVPNIDMYFDRLGETVDGIPAANIFNYDETAMHDNPGRKKVLVRRGTKHPKLVRHASKSMTTVMFCGSASGVLLPPYVIYGSETINSSWMEREPKGSPRCTDRCCKAGARYSATSSGWIDTSTFENWFETVFFPHARRLNGPKMIIGDNLNAHFSDKVIDICRNNDIRFCSLPPNSTNLTQPLDLAFFWTLQDSLATGIDRLSRQGEPNQTHPKVRIPETVAKGTDRDVRKVQ